MEGRPIIIQNIVGLIFQKMLEVILEKMGNKVSEDGRSILLYEACHLMSKRFWVYNEVRSVDFHHVRELE